MRSNDLLWQNIEPLKKTFEALFDHFELVEADFCDEACIIKAAEGCAYIVHTASPFPLDAVKDEQILIKPAVEGTLDAIKAAQQQHKWMKFVVTSSIMT